MNIVDVTNTYQIKQVNSDARCKLLTISLSFKVIVLIRFGLRDLCLR